MIQRYYENELRYLHEAAQAFAAAFPEQARFLNVDSLSDRDPYVERLFEGFAFLAGRVHERLDDDLPEVTQRLVGLLYPHFLKPFPSCSIVHFKPKSGMVQQATALPRGTEVQSQPVGSERCACVFTTSSNVLLNPIELTAFETRYSTDETSSFRLTFQLARGADPTKLDLRSLRLFIHADSTIATTAHLFLTRYVKRMEVSLAGNDSPLRVVRGEEAATPGGFGKEESLLPPEPGAFSGVRLLQEYLLYRRRFMFVDLNGIGALPEDFTGDTFHVEIFFDRVYPEDRRCRKENIYLHCVPAVNIFDHDAEPQITNHTESEIRVIPSLKHSASIATYDVQAVIGVEEISGKRHDYRPYLSFVHPSAADSGRTFSISRRVGVTGRPEVYISPALPQLVHAEAETETLSIALKCTNHTLPNEALQEKNLNQVGRDSPKIVEPENLDRPSLIRYPPIAENRELLWAFVSHWAFNHQTIASADALRGLLELYDWSGSEGNRRRRKGIRSVKWSGKETMIRGAVRRGAEVMIQIEDGASGDDGELCLFGLVLSTLLSQYATINSFVHLSIESVPSGKRFSWTPDRGYRPPV